MRIVLTEDDFKTLVSGEVVKQDGAEIILQDIGWPMMIHIVETVESKSKE
jgi:hypothetical protein